MATMENLEELQSFFTGEIRKNELLKYHTGLRIGGPADLLMIPQGIEDLRSAITNAGKNCISFQIIGNGTSMLAPPEGFQGWVIKLANVLNHIQVKGNRIYAGAGATMTSLIRQSVSHDLTGLEDWWGVPTTIGGWLVRMGLAKNQELDHLIQEVYLMEPDGLISRWIEPSQLFDLDRQTMGAIVEVVFHLQVGNKREIYHKLQQRQAEWQFLTQTHLPLAGPVFLPVNSDLTPLFVQKKLSGLRRGQAAFLGVSNGYVANLGGAVYDDVLALLTEIKEKVSDCELDFSEGLNLLKSGEVIGC